MKKRFLVLKIKDQKTIKKVVKKANGQDTNYWKKYKDLETSNRIYQELTNHFFYEDIYIYSADEYFIDITNYLDIYRKTTYRLALDLKNKLTKKLAIKFKIGLGPNIFLAKTAVDIITQKNNLDVAFLDEKEYISLLSNHKPLTDFWQISNSMALKLSTLQINTMEDIRNYSYEKLYQEFGYNAEYLINHSLGLEPASIKDLEEIMLPKAISACTNFHEIKSTKESYYELQKLLDFNILKLKENNFYTKSIYIYIKYAKDIKRKDIFSIKLSYPTNSYHELMHQTLKTFNENVNAFFPIEKIAISFSEIKKYSSKNEYLAVNIRKNKLSALPNYLEKLFFANKNPKNINFIRI